MSDTYYLIHSSIEHSKQMHYSECLNAYGSDIHTYLVHT